MEAMNITNVPSCLRFWPISFVECYSWPRNETLVLQSTFFFFFFREKLHYKALEWSKWKMQVMKLLYIALFKGGNDLCGGWSGSAKEIAWDALHIRIVVDVYPYLNCWWLDIVVFDYQISIMNCWWLDYLYLNTGGIISNRKIVKLKIVKLFSIFSMIDYQISSLSIRNS